MQKLSDTYRALLLIGLISIGVFITNLLYSRNLHEDKRQVRHSNKLNESLIFLDKLVVEVPLYKQIFSHGAKFDAMR